ncbi:hypothetical protein PZ938_04245 [Luteipulveratus sp. YIM 133132]|uniref:hypothetical protein n=1 Tax=Luteipulveratus flavus TaxID=3031728 RepID=UPI0023B13E0B|nr:hypothetical protein [Luteipulveratus sp. YIM 133132]MDE9364805.1 hypothetical protein [Luteipulveratus sp. YIM 133132]
MQPSTTTTAVTGTDSTGTRTDRPAPTQHVATRVRRVAMFLGVWSGGFAVVHLAWAAGWRWGVPSDAAPIADRPFFLAYDMVAGLLMLASAAVCIPFWRGHARTLWRRATLVGAVLALLRGVPALVFDVTSGTYGVVSFGADVWFTVAGVAGLALLRWSR